MKIHCLFLENEFKDANYKSYALIEAILYKLSGGMIYWKYEQFWKNNILSLEDPMIEIIQCRLCLPLIRRNKFLGAIWDFDLKEYKEALEKLSDIKGL